jgi:hypothetical protein
LADGTGQSTGGTKCSIYLRHISSIHRGKPLVLRARCSSNALARNPLICPP